MKIVIVEYYIVAAYALPQKNIDKVRSVRLNLIQIVLFINHNCSEIKSSCYQVHQDLKSIHGENVSMFSSELSLHII